MAVELSQEKSQEQADIIKIIWLDVRMLDIPYCRELVKELNKKASFSESAFVLNPNPSFSKIELLRLQAKAIKYLCDYVDTLKEIDDAKNDVRKEEMGKQLLAKSFC